MKTKRIIISTVLFIMLLFSCSTEEVFEDALTCREIVNKNYSELVIKEALNNGWIPNNIYINLDSPLEPGFLIWNHDPNVQIFNQAMDKYFSDWQESLISCGEGL